MTKQKWPTASAKMTYRGWAIWQEDLQDFMRVDFGIHGYLPVALWKTKYSVKDWMAVHGLREDHNCKIKRVFVDVSF